MTYKIFIVVLYYLVVFKIKFGIGEYFETFVDDDVGVLLRNAINIDSFKWPNGEIYYKFNDKYSENDQEKVLSAIDLIERETCIQFIPHSDENITYIEFIKAKGCGSQIGYRANQEKPLIVAYSEHCLSVPGAIQHELLHVAGLFHEQCRPDRDDYIKVLWDNIEPQFHSNFMKGPKKYLTTFDLPYDYNSLMHYPKNAFAKNEAEYTIVAINDTEMELGQSNGPTFFDLEKIRRMYEC